LVFENPSGIVLPTCRASRTTETRSTVTFPMRRVTDDRDGVHGRIPDVTCVADDRDGVRGRLPNVPCVTDDQTGQPKRERNIPPRRVRKRVLYGYIPSRVEGSGTSDFVKNKSTSYLEDPFASDVRRVSSFPSRVEGRSPERATSLKTSRPRIRRRILLPRTYGPCSGTLQVYA